MIHRIKIALFGLWILISVIIVLASIEYYKYERNQIRFEQYENLKTIANLKDDLINKWRKQIIDEAQNVAVSPFLAEEIGLWKRERNDRRLEKNISDGLQAARAINDFQNIFLISPSCELLIAAGREDLKLNSFTRDELVHSALTKKIYFSDLMRDSLTGSIFLELIQPVINSDGETEGLLLIRVNPYKYLYPLIQLWPDKSRSAETLLIRKEGSGILFLNELRHRTNTALSFYSQDMRNDMPAVRAVAGDTGIFEGIDYRGVKVLADIRPIRGTNWFMVSKVDSEEIFSELKYRTGVIILTASIIALLFFLSFAFIYKSRQKAYYMELFDKEKNLREEREKQKLIEESSNRFVALYYNMAEGVALHEIVFNDKHEPVNYRIIDVNPQYEKILETKGEWIIGKLATDAYQTDDPPYLKEYSAVAINRVSYRFETYFEPMKRYFDISVAPWMNFGFATIFEDITNRKKAELNLRDREELLEVTLNSIGDAVISTDNSGIITYMNPVAEILTGWSGRDAVGSHLTDIFKIINSETREPVENPVFEVIKEGNKVGLANHTVLISKDSREYQIADSAAPIKDRNGTIIGVVLVFSDITEKYELSSAIEESEQILRESQTAAGIGNFIFYADAGIWKSSKMLDLILGIDISYAKTIEGWYNLIHPDDRRKINDYLSNYMREKGSVDKNSFRMIRQSDQAGIWVEVISRVERDSTGKLIKMMGTIQDITESKAAGEKFEQTLNEMEAIFRALPDLYFQMRSDGTIVEYKSGWGQKVYMPPEHFIGRKMQELLPSQVGADLEKALHDISLGTKYVLMEYALPVDGELKYYEARILPMQNGRVVALVRDITERKRAEEELINAKEQAEKSERLKSDFLAQMSHEIRSPINNIFNFNELIRDNLTRERLIENQEYFAAIEQAGERIVRTIDLILNMSELQSGNYTSIFRNIDFNTEVIQKIYPEFMHKAEKKKLNLVLKLSREPIIVSADEYSLVQIFVNLIDNAIKYTYEGNVEIITTINADGRPEARIIDSGIGISEKYLENIFTPFSQEEQGYTRRFEGNGLGLALVKRYCEINNAEVFVESAKGVGSTFRVVFKEN
jgi:PAS domain S-box-containing protein